MASAPVTDEFKTDSKTGKLVNSPPHIFDNKLFERIPAVDADPLDLSSKTTVNSNDPTEEKSVSLEFQVMESQTYSMYDAICFSPSYLSANSHKLLTRNTTSSVHFQ